MNFNDEVRDLLIMFSFPERWNGLVMVVSKSVPVSNYTLRFDDVVGVILSQEMRRKNIGESSGNALTMESRGIQRERGNILSNRINSRKSRYNSILGKIECWNYGKR